MTTKPDPLLIEATDKMATLMAGFAVQYESMRKRVSETVVAAKAKKELEARLAKVKEVIEKLT